MISFVGEVVVYRGKVKMVLSDTDCFAVYFKVHC